MECRESVGRERERERWWWVGWKVERVVGLRGWLPLVAAGGGAVGGAGGAGAAGAARYKPVRVNNRPSDVIAPRDTSVAFKWLLSRLCLDADVDLWNSIKLYGIPYRPNRVAASRSKRSQTHVIFFTRAHRVRVADLAIAVYAAFSRLLSSSSANGSDAELVRSFF